MQHKPRPPIKSSLPDLTGKKIFLAGSITEAKYLEIALKEAGATVVYPDNTRIVDGMSRGNAKVVAEEVTTSAPDAVVVYHPNIKAMDGVFADDPTMLLTAKIKSLNLPVLVVDTLNTNRFSESETLQMQQNGITDYWNSLDNADPFALASFVAQMIADKGKPSAGHASGACG